MFLLKNPVRKVQITGDLKDDTIIYQGRQLPCKNDQRFCDPTTRTQATFVWLPEYTCTTFQVARIHTNIIRNTLLNQSLMINKT